LPNFTKLWDDLVQEEIRLESCSVKQEEAEEVALIGRTKKGSKKGYSKGKREGSSSRKKDLSKLKCFRCHQWGDYANKCLKYKKGKAKKKQVATSTFAGMDEGSSQLETAFSMVS
jgi:hypothetical protein